MDFAMNSLYLATISLKIVAYVKVQDACVIRCKEENEEDGFIMQRAKTDTMRQCRSVRNCALMERQAAGRQMSAVFIFVLRGEGEMIIKQHKCASLLAAVRSSVFMRVPVLCLYHADALQMLSVSTLKHKNAAAVDEKDTTGLQTLISMICIILHKYFY